MKMKALKSVIFCAICVVLFFAVQHILMRDWADEDNLYYTIRGIQEIDEDALEILFIGSSVTETGISPMRLYEDTGICSYNLGTPAQSVVCSFFLLRDALKDHAPSLVIFDADGLFFDGDDKSWRYILDNLDLSQNKIEMAEAYENAVPGGDKWSAIFPIIKYHTRWSELNSNDFKFQKNVDYYSAGQYVFTTVTPSAMTRDDLTREESYMLAAEQGKVKYLENGTEGEYATEIPLYSATISENNRNYLLKIKQLCENHGAQLILTKVPNMLSPAINTGSWTKSKYFLTKALADEYGIAYFDLLYDTESGTDFATDTSDGGIHLNIRGAEKATQALEEYLVANYDLKKNSDPGYDAKLEMYRAVRDMAYLQSEMSFDKYTERLERNKDRWTILIAAKDNYVSTSNPLNYDGFEKLGLQLISKGELWDSYVAVIDKGVVKYEGLSDRALTYSTSLENINVSLTSLGWFSGWQTPPYASIIVNGQETAVNGEGINIVVYDNESGLVIDSASFDTFQDSRPAIHRWWENFTALRTYEQEYCFK